MFWLIGKKKVVIYENSVQTVVKNTIKKNTNKYHTTHPLSPVSDPLS